MAVSSTQDEMPGYNQAVWRRKGSNPATRLTCRETSNLLWGKLNTCKSQILQPGRPKIVDNKSKEEVNATWHVKGLIGKEEELDEVLQQRHKTAVISETKKKLQRTKDTRNYSTTYSGFKIYESNLE